MNTNDNNDGSTAEPTDDQLAQLPPEKLAQMVREKRQAEGRYRTQLREAEAERDRLAETVQGYQRSTFEEFARGRKVLDSAVDDVADKVNVAELLGEDGRLDEERAGAALEELRTSRPHYFEAAPRKSSADFTGSAAGQGDESASWSNILAG
ncbi:MAG: hypothetical protein ACTIB2_11190 [Brachybacterium tyrofermentans]